MMTALKTSTTLSRAMPHCSTTLLDHCGHDLMAEQPDAVLDALFAFASA
jgi:pimeloyl-ACP methyl ester carboxylesterase